jgi:hypothetical protein
MAEEVTARERDAQVERTALPSGGVEYRFPVEVEVHSALDDASLEQVAHVVLKLLTQAVKSK